MRGCEPNGVEKKVSVSVSVVPVVSRFGPTITGRVTGSLRNLHGGAMSVKATILFYSSRR